MQKRLSKYSDKDKPNWEWAQVQCTLKINQSNKKSVLWNLAPSITLTNPSSQCSDPNVRLYIDTQKSLQYSPQLGWNWHKSWNLPNISLRLQIKDQNNGEILLAPKNLYAQIFAVKKNSQSQRNDHMTLIDVGIRGESKIEMVDGQVYFSAMKFSSTTYNNEGMNFNLLVVLYINQDTNEKPKILTAVISPGIFVDSRRSARDYQQKKFNSFIQPFLYENLEKEYIKRQNKSKTQSQILIKNDPEGFYNYLTAPNIRHKVKHPIFLAIKFSNCVKILFNIQLLENLNAKHLIENLQKKLLKQNKNKQKNQNGFLGNPNEKTFIFLVENMNDSLKKKKVMESIETMQNSAIGIVYDRSQLNVNFQSIGDEQTLTKAYRQSYQNLLEQCKKYQPSDSESESQEQDQDLPSQKSIKKVKFDQYQKINTRNHLNKKLPNGSFNQGSYEKAFLKKEQDENLLQQPKFFPPILNDIGSKKGSAFNRAVGFKSINPQIEENQMKNNFDNFDYPINRSQAQSAASRINKNISINSEFNMNSQHQGKNLESLIGNNLMLSSWLNNVKNNNVNLYDTMTGNNLAQSILNQSMDRFGNRNQSRNNQNPYQVNEQLQCLIQQVNLYRQLLAQITYQNALLGRGFPPNSTSTNGQTPNMSYPPQLIHGMASTMAGLSTLGVSGLGLGQLGGLSGLGGLGGLNLSSLGGNGNMNSSGLPNLNSSALGNSSLSGQGFSNQNGLGNLLPHLQNLQSLQALQTLSNLSSMFGGYSGSMLGAGLGGLPNNTQSSSLNLNLNEILRNHNDIQSRTNQQQKRGKDQK